VARQHVPPPRHPHESRRGARDVGSQSTLDGTPRHRIPQHRFDRSMDLPSPHRLPPATQDVDQSINHPARSSRSKPLARSQPQLRSTGSHCCKLLGQPDQRPLDLMVR
jgi:hypothetical protein